MDWTLVQKRSCGDTFAGGGYHRDMRESPELQPRFPSEGCELSGERYMSERQKELRGLWKNNRDKSSSSEKRL